MNSLIQTKILRVGIIGLPNAGKSTLLNALIGFRLAPVHRKPQMTRKNLLGLLTEGDCQIIFTDTPGLNTREDGLSKLMRKEISKVLEATDLMLLLWGIDQNPFEEFCKSIQPVLNRMPCVLVLNKVDLKIPHKQVVLDFAKEKNLPIVEVSAKTKIGFDVLLNTLKAKAYPHEFLYPEDDLSATSMRDIAKNTIQESMMEALHEELPYQTAVVIESYQEDKDRHTIRATLVVNRDSQKGMVIGKGGATLKRIGQRARLNLEKNFGVKIKLELFVKVESDWIKNQNLIEEYN